MFQDEEFLCRFVFLSGGKSEDFKHLMLTVQRRAGDSFTLFNYEKNSFFQKDPSDSAL